MARVPISKLAALPTPSAPRFLPPSLGRRPRPYALFLCRRSGQAPSPGPPTPPGPGDWGGDWYLWHSPDGLRARAATGLGCVQADAEKLGAREAIYTLAV